MQLVTVRSPEPVGGKMAAPTGKGTPTDDHSRRPETLQGRQWKGGPRGGEVEKGARAIGGKNPLSQHSVLPTWPGWS